MTSKYLVTKETSLALDILQAEFTDIDDGLVGEFLGVGREVPRLHAITTQFYQLYVFHSCDDIVWSMACPTAR